MTTVAAWRTFFFLCVWQVDEWMARPGGGGGALVKRLQWTQNIVWTASGGFLFLFRKKNKQLLRCKKTSYCQCECASV